MSTVSTIHIDFGKKCNRCDKPGAVNGGACLRCVLKRMKAGERDTYFAKLLAKMKKG